MSNTSYSDDLRRTIEDAVGRVGQAAQAGAEYASAPRAPVRSGRPILLMFAAIVFIIAVCGGVAFVVERQATFSGGIPRRLLGPSLPGLLIVLIAVTIIAVGLIWLARSRRRLQRSATASAALPTMAIAGQITRLEQLRDWMTEDKAFAQLVDSMIGRQVQAAEVRQRNRAIMITVVTSVLSLAAGWLLTSISPGAVAALFGH